MYKLPMASFFNDDFGDGAKNHHYITFLLYKINFMN